MSSWAMILRDRHVNTSRTLATSPMIVEPTATANQPPVHFRVLTWRVSNQLLLPGLSLGADLLSSRCCPQGSERAREYHLEDLDGREIAEDLGGPMSNA